MTNAEWKLVSRAIKWILDERIDLPIDNNTKITSIDELSDKMRGWQFEVMLSGSLELTERALIDAVENMSEAHRLAAKIKLRKPNPEEIKVIKEDLNAVSKSLNADTDTYLAAVGTVLSSLETLIN